MTFAVFPLSTVLCPGGRAPLQVFEQRYLEMLRQVMKTGEGFLVTLIQSGREVGGSCAFHDVGTHVHVVDFTTLENGLLGITVEAQNKVRLIDPYQEENGLYRAHCERLPEEPFVALPESCQELADLTRDLMRHPVVSILDMSLDTGDARQVGWRLVELLPLPLEDKQYLFSLTDPLKRLDQLRYLLHTMQ